VKDRDFDDLMEKWAEAEAESAHDLRPTAAMYEAVRGFKRAGKPVPFFRRWLALSAAAAALLVLAIIYPVLFRPSPGPPEWLGRELDLVGLREIPVSGKGAEHIPQAEKALAEADAVSPKRGKKGRAEPLRRAEFQFRMEQAPEVLSFDLRHPREETISLTSADSYRLVLEPVDELHIYVFQFLPQGILIRLFPNDKYAPYRNPLDRGQAYHLPPEPTWFHPGRQEGEERLYVLASPELLQDLENLYSEYAGEIPRSRREALLGELLGRIDSVMAGDRRPASGWMLPFRHR
jgi:hypothetical protein